jgi:hypothetical protein
MKTDQRGRLVGFRGGKKGDSFYALLGFKSNGCAKRE